jgi:hypothetical protein
MLKGVWKNNSLESVIEYAEEQNLRLAQHADLYNLYINTFKIEINKALNTDLSKDWLFP